ncbi:MAG: hypothetical protein ACRD0P_03055 [Stackebrandtia sp.]
MNESFDPFEVDPRAVWNAGAIALPKGAMEFTRMATALNESIRSQTAGFQHYALTDAAQPWIELRDLLQTIFADSSRNLIDTGDTLCLIAHDYVRNDLNNSYNLQPHIDAMNIHPTLGPPEPGTVHEGPRPYDPTRIDSTPRGPGGQ